MKAKTLIEQVEKEKMNEWNNSDITRDGEKALEEMSKHFSVCAGCASDFDVMEYPEKTIKDFFEKRLATKYKKEEWICSE